jgi:hypothetical protein
MIVAPDAVSAIEDGTASSKSATVGAEHRETRDEVGHVEIVVGVAPYIHGLAKARPHIEQIPIRREDLQAIVLAIDDDHPAVAHNPYGMGIDELPWLLPEGSP